MVLSIAESYFQLQVEWVRPPTYVEFGFNLVPLQSISASEQYRIALKVGIANTTFQGFVRGS
jgi:hypothetical protein